MSLRQETSVSIAQSHSFMRLDGSGLAKETLLSLDAIGDQTLQENASADSDHHGPPPAIIPCNHSRSNDRFVELLLSMQ